MQDHGSKEQLIGRRDTLVDGKLELASKDYTYKVIDIIIDSYLNDLPPYNNAIMPQTFKPDSLSAGGNYYQQHEHAMYFWNICSYMSGRIKSDVAFKRMTNIFNQNSNFFDSNFLSDADPEFIANILKENGLGRQNQVANNLIENAKRLVDNYGGDPRNIFNGAVNYEECVRRIKNNNGQGFLGFREKMTSMIIYYYIDQGLISGINFPVPVDFHVQRIAFATRMIDSDGASFYGSAKINDQLRELFSDYINDRGIDPLDLTNSVWLLSSNLCNKSIGNLSAMTDSGARAKYNELDKDSLYHSETWNRSCGKCAIESFCQYYIPSADYYSNGIIAPRKKTERRFAKQLSFFDK